MKLLSRTSFLGSLLVAGLLTGCSKDHDAVVAPESAQPQSQLVGRWLLTQTDGGLSGKTTPNDPAHPQEIIFDNSQQATFLLDGTVSRQTSYSLAPASSYLTHRNENFLTYGTRTGAEKQFISELSATKLVLKEDYADGRGYYYARQ
jgi:hypothetical protein